MNEIEERPYDVFVSYADADRDWVHGYLLDALEAAGVRAIHKDIFEIGAAPITEIERAIEQSIWTLIVISPAYMANELNQFTMLLAQHSGVDQNEWAIIPLVLEEVSSLPIYLQQIVTLDATDPEEAEFSLKRLLDQFGKKEPPHHILANPICPFQGLRPFSQQDSSLFFGRQSELQNLVERLRRDSNVLLTGPSGCGKSSLIAAGLLPLLETDDDSDFSIDRVTFVERLSPWPHTRLREAMEKVAISEEAPPHHDDPGSTILIIDHIEELFSVDGHNLEFTGFVAELAGLLSAESVKVILAMRPDHLPRLISIPEIWSLVKDSTFELKPLRPQQLRETIVEPFRTGVAYIDQALVERLIADAGIEPGSMPLVQETLLLLWERLDRRFLSLKAYESINDNRADGTAEDSCFLYQLIAQLAEDSFQDLHSDAERLIARNIYLNLVRVGEEGVVDSRRRATLNELTPFQADPATVTAVIEHLTQRRLLTTDLQQNLQVSVELAHEAIIDHWPRLQWWISERREALLIHQRLLQAASEWDRLDRASDLLYRGNRLSRAIQLLDERPDDFTSLTYTFVQASQAAEKIGLVGEDIRDLAARSQYKKALTRLEMLIGWLEDAAAIHPLLTMDVTSETERGHNE